MDTTIETGITTTAPRARFGVEPSVIVRLARALRTARFDDGVDAWERAREVEPRRLDA